MRELREHSEEVLQTWAEVQKLEDLYRGKMPHRKWKDLPMNEDLFRVSLGENKEWVLNASYFIGVDWLKLTPNEKIPFRVYPKIENTEREIDYLKMLKDALEEPSNLDYLEDLLFIDFSSPRIPIDPDNNGLLIFLVVQYLSVLLDVCRRGLRRSFHDKEDCFEYSIKGRVLLSETVKKTKDCFPFQKDFRCSYQVLDEDIYENRLLKKAFSVSKQILMENKSYSIKSENYFASLKRIEMTFKSVGDLETNVTPHAIKVSRFFRRHEQAIRLAELILRLASYGRDKRGTSTSLIPPYWINMPKLFELYCLSFLRKSLNLQGAKIEYQKNIGGIIPDFLITKANILGGNFVADAKYKPRYRDQNSSWEDAKQLSGYARHIGIRQHLKAEEGRHVHCLIIYPDQKAQDKFEFQKDNAYADFYRLAIKLPERALSQRNLG